MSVSPPTTSPIVLGEGLRATVHPLGDGRAVKLARPETPDAWLDEEFRCHSSVLRSNAPCPGAVSLVRVDDRTGLACERIDGPTIWQLLEAEPGSAVELGRILARLQRSLFDLEPSFDLPRQGDRLQVKLRMAARTFDLQLGSVAEFVRSVEESSAKSGICHGDLHPHNVIVAPTRGPVLVDWFDAAAGVLVAEIARTSVLLSSSSEDPLRRAGPDLAPALAALRDAYVEDACTNAGIGHDELDRWVTVQLATRLAEGLGDGRVTDVQARLARFETV